MSSTTEMNPDFIGNSTGQDNKLVSNISDALVLARQLEHVLNEAHQLMLKRDIVGIEIYLENQVTLLDKLNLNASLREHFLKESGYPSGRQGIHAFLKHIINTPWANQIAPQWQQLALTTERCSRINKANGRLLSRLAASTQQMRELMFSQQESTPYNQQGICEPRLGR